MSAAIDALCVRHGIARSYLGMNGEPVHIAEETKHAMLAALGIDPAGTRASKVASPTIDESADNLPEVAPARCYMPEWLKNGRAWGIALQLYQLRSARSLGIGDYRDLADVIAIAAADGADFVGLNPLHALFLSAPARCSPFSPSNRRFLNPLYIAIDDAPGHEPADVPPAVAARLASSDLVDYESVAAAKIPALRAAWQRWRKAAPRDHWACEGFEAFLAGRGQQLVDHATFEALAEQFSSRELAVGWHAWPEPLRDARSKEVRTFAAKNAEAIEFHAWLQWVANHQLATAAALAHDAGMRIGLYLDLAVGEAPDGSATWSEPELIIPDLKIGAPPDLFNAKGQDWGLAPVSPVALAERDYAPLASLLEHVMRGAGALRLDHVMGLLRLYCIPQGLSARDGTYVRYQIESALGAVAEVSRATRAVIIGEDLGNVPTGFRDLMASAEIQSYRLLYFERTGKRPARPQEYPVAALSCLSTHDLPPLAGWWKGLDIDIRLEVAQIDAKAAVEEKRDRLRLMGSLLHSMAAEGRISDPARITRQESLDDSTAAALHGHLASSPSRLMAVRLEDLASEVDAVNVPGTVDEHPNWRRRLSLSAAEIARSPRYRAIVDAVAAERPRR